MAARSSCYAALCIGASACLGALGGCADDGVSVHVTCAIRPALEEDVCIFDPSAGECLTDGWMNLAATSLYRVSLRVESGLVARQRSVPPQGEPNGLQLRTATVELRLPTGEKIQFEPDPLTQQPVRNPFEVIGTGYVEPGGLGAMSIPVITDAHARQLQASPNDTTPAVPMLIAAIRVHGVTNGQTEVTTGEYLWPVHLVSANVEAGSTECAPMDYCDAFLGQDFYVRACR